MKSETRNLVIFALFIQVGVVITGTALNRDPQPLLTDRITLKQQEADNSLSAEESLALEGKVWGERMVRKAMEMGQAKEIMVQMTLLMEATEAGDDGASAKILSRMHRDYPVGVSDLPSVGVILSKDTTTL